MTVKFLHVRVADVEGNIDPRDGVTIAYTVIDTPGVAGLAVNLAKCHPDDRFDYKVGRETASNKLLKDGPLEVLPLEHPISETILDWLMNNWWPSRRKYGGYAIDIMRLKDRWISDFTPSQSECE